MSHHFIQFKDVHYRYPGGHEALRGVNLYITHGEKVAIVGANGAGKSTLALHCNGILIPTSGEVNIGGVIVSKQTLPMIRMSVGYVFQNPDDQLFMPTVEEDVAFGPRNMHLSEHEVEERVNSALAAVGELKKKNISPTRLSGGEKQRVAIATVLSMTPNILVLDEPTSNLDPKARNQLIELISSFEHTSVVITHDLDMAWTLCKRTIILKDGEVFADGPTHELFLNKELIEQAGLVQPYQALFRESRNF